MTTTSYAADRTALLIVGPYNDLMSNGTLRLMIARTFAFDQIADAHRLIETGEQIGKVIVTL